MTDIGSAVSLIVAISQLKAVQAVRRPILANLIARGGIEGALGTVTMPHGRVPLPERKPDTQFHDRQLIAAVDHRHQPAPVRTVTTVERVRAVPAIERIDVIQCEPRPTEKSSPLLPPWRMPIAEPVDQSSIVIKCPAPPPDVINKGSLLDFFM